MNRTFWIILATVSMLSVVCGIGAGAWTRDNLQPARHDDEKQVAHSAPTEEKPVPAPAVELLEEPEERPAAEVEPPPEVAEVAEAPALIPETFDIDEIAAERWARLAGLIQRSGDGDPETRSGLESFRAEIQGKLPTENPDGKGELTHPIVVARVVASLLEASGLALDAEQWGRIAAEVEAYDEALGEHQAGYGDDTIRLERILDEIELKEGFLEGLFHTLGDEQRLAVAARAPDGERWPEFLSPLYMADTHARPVPGDPVELANFQRLMTEDLAEDTGIEPEVAQRLAEAFCRDLQPLLQLDASLSKLDRALIAGRASVRLFSEVLRNEGVPEKIRDRALTMRHWMVPELPGE